MLRPRGRPFEFPDPNDRSVNEPHVKLERLEILGLYNQSTNNDAKNVSETVKDWIRTEALNSGWATVNFVENTAILGANIALSPPNNE